MSVEDIPAIREFPRMHHAIDGAMRRQLGLRAAQHKLKRKALALQYRTLFEQWQSRCAGMLYPLRTYPCMALECSTCGLQNSLSMLWIMSKGQQSLCDVILAEPHCCCTATASPIAACCLASGDAWCL